MVRDLSHQAGSGSAFNVFGVRFSCGGRGQIESTREKRKEKREKKEKKGRKEKKGEGRNIKKEKETMNPPTSKQ